MPDLGGLASAKAVDALTAKKLVPKPTGVFSATVPAGQVVSQDPPAGAGAKEGQQVTVLVSLGFPAILLNLNNNIVSIGGGSGQPVKKVAASSDVEEEPSITPDGKVVVYKRHAAQGDGLGQLWTSKVGDANSAQPLTTPGFDDGRPAVSPDGRVVAFVSNRKAADPKDTDLCFTRLDQAGAQPDCVVDGSTTVSRPAWAPDGRSIVVVGSDQQQAAAGQTELLLYTSQTPNASTAAEWLRQGFVTDAMHGQERDDQVISAAFAPDGTRLAFTATWSGGAKVFVAVVEGGVIATAKPKAVPRVSACELSWRPDSGELAIAVRDRGCDQEGRIFRVDPKAPEQQIALTGVSASAGNPVWFPVVTP
ncbi:MAG: PASTA domain-containing protein [Actinomycetota bacterium]